MKIGVLTDAKRDELVALGFNFRRATSKEEVWYRDEVQFGFAVEDSGDIRLIMPISPEYKISSSFLFDVMAVLNPRKVSMLCN